MFGGLVFAALLCATVGSRCSGNVSSVPCESWLRWDTPQGCEERGCCVHDGVLCRYPGVANDVPVKVVHVVQGCHLDIGFVASAVDIINRWWHQFFPRALQVGTQLKQRGGAAQLKFTAQSWLVATFLNCPPQLAALGVICPTQQEITDFKSAVAQGFITWHAFPFNGEAELMNAWAFDFALNLTHQTDDALGVPRKTVMSQRDVPGMTSSTIDVLLKNGIQAISFGSNGGSAPPNVPKAFIWRNGEGKSIRTFFLQGGYSGVAVPPLSSVTRIPGSEHAMVVKWRGDNGGPPLSPDEVENDWANLRGQFGPGVEIRSSTFDDFVQAISTVPDANFPVISREIGDTWIYGVASDPIKLSQLRILQNLQYDCFQTGQCSLSDPRVWAFSVLALKNYEHTWGRDQKVILGTNYTSCCWENADFARLQNSQAFVNYTSSWLLQRALGIAAPVSALGSHPLAQRLRDALIPWQPSVNGWKLVSTVPNSVNVGPFSLTFNAQGAVIGIQKGGVTLTSETLAKPFVYTAYSWDDYHQFASQYNYGYPAMYVDKLDFLKTNLPSSAKHLDVVATFRDALINPDGSAVQLRFGLPSDLSQIVGAASDYYIQWRFDAAAQRLQVIAAWANKTATRLPESTAFPFRCSSGFGMTKLGAKVDPLNVNRGGSKHLHSVESLQCQNFAITPVDAPLVSFGTSSAFPTPNFGNISAVDANFILHNNLWNTNYIMWFPYNDKDSKVYGARYWIDF